MFGAHLLALDALLKWHSGSAELRSDPITNVWNRLCGRFNSTNLFEPEFTSGKSQGTLHEFQFTMKTLSMLCNEFWFEKTIEIIINFRDDTTQFPYVFRSSIVSKHPRKIGKSISFFIACSLGKFGVCCANKIYLIYRAIIAGDECRLWRETTQVSNQSRKSFGFNCENCFYCTLIDGKIDNWRECIFRGKVCETWSRLEKHETRNFLQLCETFNGILMTHDLFAVLSENLSELEVVPTEIAQIFYHRLSFVDLKSDGVPWSNSSFPMSL